MTVCLYLDSLFGGFLCEKDRAVLRMVWLWLYAEWCFLVAAWRRCGTTSVTETSHDWPEPECFAYVLDDGSDGEPPLAYQSLSLEFEEVMLWEHLCCWQTDTHDTPEAVYPALRVYVEPPNEHPEPVVCTLQTALAQLCPVEVATTPTERQDALEALYRRVPYGKKATRYVVADPATCGTDVLYRKVKGRYVLVS